MKTHPDGWNKANYYGDSFSDTDISIY
jgi:hypothetical protein